MARVIVTEFISLDGVVEDPFPVVLGTGKDGVVILTYEPVRG